MVVRTVPPLDRTEGKRRDPAHSEENGYSALDYGWGREHVVKLPAHNAGRWGGERGIARGWAGAGRAAAGGREGGRSGAAARPCEPGRLERGAERGKPNLWGWAAARTLQSRAPQPETPDPSLGQRIRN